MGTITLEGDTLVIGRLRVSFMRTLRLPDDGGAYPLPPGLGLLPLHRVEDHAARVPPAWLDHGGVFLPMHGREAMWLRFEAPSWHPQAVKVAAGMVNAVSGDPWDDRIDPRRGQDYLVCPGQPWLDGINSGDGTVRQFVAMPLGMGYTVEGQVSGQERFGGVQLAVFPPRPGRFPEAPPRRAWSPEPEDRDVVVTCEAMPAPRAAEMGLAAGGRMMQEIVPDPYGAGVWRRRPEARVYVHIVDAADYRRITGRPAPPSPVDARLYAAYGLPWFRLAGDDPGDVPASETLAGVRSVSEMDAVHGFSGLMDDAPVDIDPATVVPVAPAPPAAAPPGGAA